MLTAAGSPTLRLRIIAKKFSRLRPGCPDLTRNFLTKANFSTGVSIMTGSEQHIDESATLDRAVSEIAFLAQVYDTPRHSLSFRSLLLYTGMPVFASGCLINVVLTYPAEELATAAIIVLSIISLGPLAFEVNPPVIFLRVIAVRIEAETEAE